MRLYLQEHISYVFLLCLEEFFIVWKWSFCIVEICIFHDTKASSGCVLLRTRFHEGF